MMGMFDNLTRAWMTTRANLRTRYLNGQIDWDYLVSARARLDDAYDTRWKKIRGSF